MRSIFFAIITFSQNSFIYHQNEKILEKIIKDVSLKGKDSARIPTKKGGMAHASHIKGCECQLNLISTIKGCCPPSVFVKSDAPTTWFADCNIGNSPDGFLIGNPHMEFLIGNLYREFPIRNSYREFTVAIRTVIHYREFLIAFRESL